MDCFFVAVTSLLTTSTQRCWTIASRKTRSFSRHPALSRLMDLVSQRSGLMGPLQDLPQGQKTASSCQDNNIPDGFVSSNSEASATTPTYGVGSRDWATATQSVFTDNKRTHILQLGFDVQQADINPRKPQYYPPRPPSSPSYSRHLPQSHPSARLLPPPLIHEKNCFLKSDFGLGVRSPSLSNKTPVWET